MVRRSWDRACEELGERIPLTPAISKLVRTPRLFPQMNLDHRQISSRGPHLRGELKTKVRAFSEVMYGFKTGNNKKTIAFNRKRAEELKEGSRFAFKVCVPSAADPNANPS